ncbi:MAG: hypothetical protein M1827_006286 [Pycnora praestabilis]|nr:MAG: hypothetical protein M1827_006286 [Pycnora praestabilis]
MPPPKSKKRVSEVEDYEADGGFVVEDDGTEEPRPSKKVKMEKDAARTHKKAAEALTRRDAAVDDNGDMFWELSSSRRITISEFPKGKGKYMINIREYYEKDGKTLPGKKGISLPIEQFSTLVTILPELEAHLKDKGLDVARPAYEKSDRSYAGVAEFDNEGDEEQTQRKDGNSRREDASPKKKNFEATSEEDEGDESEQE